MSKKRRQLVAFVFLLTILATTACSAPPRAPDLGGLYSELAQNEDSYRNPVILIPGILGSKLVDDIFDPELWRKNGWGLSDARQDKILRMLLPEEESPEKRTQMAFEYLIRVLNRAKLFTEVMDVPARPPETLHLYLVAGDAEDTDKISTTHWIYRILFEL